MARYLFDTNHLSAAIDDEAGIRERIVESRQAGHRLGTYLLTDSKFKNDKDLSCFSRKWRNAISEL
jgi:hypothetical protein